MLFEHTNINHHPNNSNTVPVSLFGTRAKMGQCILLFVVTVKDECKSKRRIIQEDWTNSRCTKSNTVVRLR